MKKYFAIIALILVGCGSLSLEARRKGHYRRHRRHHRRRHRWGYPYRRRSHYGWGAVAPFLGLSIGTQPSYSSDDETDNYISVTNDAPYPITVRTNEGYATIEPGDMKSIDRGSSSSFSVSGRGISRSFTTSRNSMTIYDANGRLRANY